MFKIDKRLDLDFYIMGWCGIGAAVLVLLITHISHFDFWKLLGPCVFHRLTGYYCPGCGGTRAVQALLAGRPFLSFCYHPFVLYGVVVCGWFMLSQTIERISGGRIEIGLHFREIYIWIAIALIITNCLIKNFALGVWHIDLLKLPY